MITRNSTPREVALAVCTALDKGGHTAVLTGGGAATVWAPHAYQSSDLDFVLVFKAPDLHESILTSLGYARSGDHYEHKDSELFLEFPPGPLSVGGDLISNWDTLREGKQLLHIITPTDSCRDRLAPFLFWTDRSSLDQAIAVAQAHRKRIDLDSIESWCKSEEQEAKFKDFANALT